MPRVSILIPNFNTEAYLGRAIQSVLEQSFTDWELIIVDDGSRIDPKPYIPAQDDRIRLLYHPENKGLSATRNTAIEAANGEIIACLDSDDYWRPEKLQKQFAIFEQFPDIGIVFTDFRHELKDGTPVDWQGGMKQRLQDEGSIFERIDGAFVFDANVRFQLMRLTSFIHPSSFSIRRTILEKAGFFNPGYRILEDLEMWIRCTQYAKVALIDEVLVHVEQRVNSLGHNRIKLAEALVRLYSDLLETDSTIPTHVRTAMQKRLQKEHMDLGWEYLQRGEKSHSRKNYREASRLGVGRSAKMAILKSYVPNTIRRFLGK